MRGRLLACVALLLASEVAAQEPPGPQPLPLGPPRLAWERCSDEDSCRVKGRCAMSGGDCFALTEAMCRASEACASDGRCVLNAEKGHCDDGLERRDRGALAGGIVLFSLGGAAILIGVVMGIITSMVTDTADSAVPIFTGLLLGGAAFTAGGIPLVVYGGEKVPRSQLMLAPGGAILRW
jgi:hypothetical protein